MLLLLITNLGKLGILIHIITKGGIDNIIVTPQLYRLLITEMIFVTHCVEKVYLVE